MCSFTTALKGNTLKIIIKNQNLTPQRVESSVVCVADLSESLLCPLVVEVRHVHSVTCGLQNVTFFSPSNHKVIWYRQKMREPHFQNV